MDGKALLVVLALAGGALVLSKQTDATSSTAGESSGSYIAPGAIDTDGTASVTPLGQTLFSSGVGIVSKKSGDGSFGSPFGDTGGGLTGQTFLNSRPGVGSVTFGYTANGGAIPLSVSTPSGVGASVAPGANAASVLARASAPVASGANFSSLSAGGATVAKKSGASSAPTASINYSPALNYTPARNYSSASKGR